MKGAILRKDWAQLWPMVALVTAIQLCWEWSQYSYGLFGGAGDLDRALSALSLAWLAGAGALAAAVVQTDAPSSVDQDWLIRPIPRSTLLFAKLIFVALSVALPCALLDWGRAILMGSPAGASLGAAALKAMLLYLYLLVPAVALAATVARMTDLLLLGAGLIVVYGVTRSLTSALLGADACPTCDTGVAWIQHLWQHLGILTGSLAILAIQYYRRAPQLSRIIALAGTALLVFAQLPWDQAFSLQRAVIGATGGTAAVQVTAGSPVDLTDPYASAGHASVPVDLPLRVTGLSPDQLLFVNRSQLELQDRRGRTLYRQPDRGTLALLASEATLGRPVTAVQSLHIPSALYTALATRTVRLQLRQWLTLMSVRARLSLPARDGEGRSDYAARCASRLSADSTQISVRCNRLGAAPVCVSATLYGPAMDHNPTVLQCVPDYRPYMPVTDIFSVFAVDVPIRDRTGSVHYAVGPAQLDRAVLRLSFYEARAHFVRRTSIPAAREN